METREDILKELEQLAPRLATLQKVNAYQVPANYFNDFEQVILDQVKPVDAKQELSAIAPVLSRLAKPAEVEVSAVYFSDFSSRIVNRVCTEDVAKELSVIAPRLAGLEKANAYTAPANYFNAFADTALRNVTAQKQLAARPLNWVIALNEFLDSLTGAIFKPRYTIAFAGLATTVIIAMVLFIKVPQLNDLDARFAQLSTDEINYYLDNKSDAYSDEVFEMNLDTKANNANPDLNNVHAYKDALKDVDDEALNDAIAD